ncbi:MAG TPA: SCP2 sterol-binding domain-containing protein [Polyangiaceae bacterium]|nr:SCP2 sterol-binding domain-containing protein [Polyangiaceae bacterium]
MMDPLVRLAPGADQNGLANMLADLLRQNMQAKPRKQADFATLDGTVAIVAEDADVALTLRFERGERLTIHDGIVGIPDVTIRGSADVIIALSNMPMATALGLPIPNPRDRESVGAVRTVLSAVGRKKLHLYGLAFHLPLVLKLGRLMSVNG